MVQVFDADTRKPASQQFGEAFGKAAQGITQHLSQQQSMSRENEAAKRMGIDLSGISDPKMRQEAFKQIAKYTAQKNMMEQLGLGGEMGRGNEPSMQAGQQQDPYMNEQGETEIGNVQVPTLIPAKKIQQMAMINPAVADKMQKHNDNIESQMRHNENVQLKKYENSPEYKRDIELTKHQATADTKFYNELQEAYKGSQIKSDTLKGLEKLNLKGVTGKPFEKALEKMGLVNLTSEGRREFASGQKNLITDIRSILGSQFSQFEFQTVLNAYPSPDFSQEANAAIIKNLMKFQDIRDHEFKIANQLKKENGGKLPEDFQEKVNERLNEYAQTKMADIKENTNKIMREQYQIPIGHTLMLDPRGEVMSVPDEEVADLLEQGAQLP